LANSQSYPRPVLTCFDGGDFPETSLKIKADRSPNGAVYTCSFIFSEIPEFFTRMLEDEAASIVIEVECPRTFYRESFRSKEVAIEFNIHKENIRDLFFLRAFICSNVKDDNYLPIGRHEDYGDFSFEIVPGDVIADGGEWKQELAGDFDTLKTPISSIMTVHRSEKLSGPFELNFKSQKIQIWLCADDHDQYKQAAHDKGASDIVHAMVVFPVLVEAINEMRKNDEENDDFLWHRRIKEILEQRDLTGDDSFLDAQNILDLPGKRALCRLSNLVNSTED
jgi:hypothetical protein